ncbi:adenylate cyclase [Pasteurellaceae bacterium 15-036681]|nr:adenylate cyclase [Pasteurellaceae bacterium 15-036681]
MSEYDYKEGKKRIEIILDNSMEIEEKGKLPSDDNFTFENGYLSWITAIFIDIRDSSRIFTDGNKEKVAKLIRAFTSELIEILRDDIDDSLVREIGIRGDCVYAIYTTPYKSDIYKCAHKTFIVNTFINMFNKMLIKRGYGELKVGIGMATDEELVIKAGRKGVGINSKVWIGKAVTMASNLSGLGEKNYRPRLIFSEISYLNFIEELKKSNPEKYVEGWFTKFNDINIGYGVDIYKTDIIDVEYSNWIKSNVA